MDRLHKRGLVSLLYAGVLFGVSLFGTQALAGDSQGLGKAQVKVAVLSASGRAGKLITQEALAKSLNVTAFVRDSKKLADSNSANLKVIGEEFEINANGESKVSYADYATAMIEIALSPKYNKERVVSSGCKLQSKFGNIKD